MHSTTDQNISDETKWEVSYAIKKYNLPPEKAWKIIEAYPEANDLKLRKALYASSRPEITKEMIDFMMNKEFSYNQTWAAGRAFDFGMPLDFAKKYISKGTSPQKINGLTNAFQLKLSVEQIEPYVNMEYTEGQMKEIWKGLKAGLSDKQMSYYALPDFKTYQMSEIRQAIESGLSDKQLKMLANPEFPRKKIRVLRLAMKNNTPNTILNLLTDKKFNEPQLWVIKQGYDNGLTYSQIMQFANPKLSVEKMTTIMVKLTDDNANHKTPTNVDNIVDDICDMISANANCMTSDQKIKIIQKLVQIQE